MGENLIEIAARRRFAARKMQLQHAHRRRLTKRLAPFVGAELRVGALQLERVGAIGALQRAAMGQFGQQARRAAGEAAHRTPPSAKAEAARRASGPSRNSRLSARPCKIFATSLAMTSDRRRIDLRQMRRDVGEAAPAVAQPQHRDGRSRRLRRRARARGSRSARARDPDAAAHSAETPASTPARSRSVARLASTHSLASPGRNAPGGMTPGVT